MSQVLLFPNGTISCEFAVYPQGNTADEVLSDNDMSTGISFENLASSIANMNAYLALAGWSSKSCTISNVTIMIDGYSFGDTVSVVSYIVHDGANKYFFGGFETLPLDTQPSSVSWSLATNPMTNLPWTNADLLSLVAGVTTSVTEVLYNSNGVMITELKIYVDYTLTGGQALTKNISDSLSVADSPVVNKVVDSEADSVSISDLLKVARQAVGGRFGVTLNSYSYTMGIKFTPLQNIKLTKLGGCWSGNNLVRLFDSAYGLICSVTLTSSGGWSYVDVTPVMLTAGVSYYLVVDLSGASGAYATLAMPMTYGDITINASVYQSPVGTFNSSSTAQTSTIYGIPDFYYELAGGSVYSDTATLSDSLLGKQIGAKTSGDTLSLATDVLTKQIITDTDENFTPITDSFVQKSMKIMDTELLGLLDSASSNLTHLAGSDSLVLADSLAKGITTSFAETLSLIDSAYRLIRVIDSDDLSLLDSISRNLPMSVSDSLSLIDSLTNTVALYKTEALALADSLKEFTDKDIDDVLALLDAITNKLLMSDTDVVSIVEDFLVTTNAPRGADAVAIADAIVRGFQPLVEDVVSATDNLNHFDIATYVADNPLITDDLSKMFSTTFSDVVGLVDNLTMQKALMLNVPNTMFGVSMFGGSKFGGGTESIGVLDNLTVQIGYRRLIDDLVTLADAVNLAYTASRTNNDSAFILDTIGVTFSKSLVDSVPLADQLTDYGLGHFFIDSLGLVENIIKSIATLLGNDLVTLNDSSFVTFTKSYSDTVSLIEVFTKLISSVQTSLLSLSDNARVAIQTSRQEALSLADLLGVQVSKTNTEAIGILDEAMISMIVRSRDTLLINDELIDCKKVVVLNQVYVNGVSIPVIGLKIQHASSERISTCTFSVPDPSPETLALFKQRAEVKAYLADGDGNTDYFGGFIVDNPVSAESAVTTMLEITVHDYTESAYNRTVTETYTNNPKLTNVIRDMWTKYNPFDYIDLSGVEDSPLTIEYISFKYDFLFDATERVAQLLGWSWYVEWQGGNKVLRFFPANGYIKDVVFSRANCNVIAGTAKFGTSDKIFNKLYLFGGTTLSVDMTYTFTTNGTDVVYGVPQPPYPPANRDMVIVKHNGVEKSVDFDYPYWVEGKDVLLNVKGRYLRYKTGSPPPAGITVQMVYRYEYPLAIVLDDAESIGRYGLIEETLSDSKITDTRQAIAYGKQYLSQYAFPKGYGSMEVTETGLRAGMIVGVYMPHLGAVGNYEIVEIEKWVEGALLRQSVTLNVAVNSENVIAQRLKDFAKRIGDLELKDVEESTVMQRINSVKEQLTFSDTLTLNGVTLYNVGSSTTVSDSVRISKTSAGVTETRYTVQDSTSVSDDNTKYVGNLYCDYIPLQHKVFVAVNTYYNAEFDESDFGSSTRFVKEVSN